MTIKIGSAAEVYYDAPWAFFIYGPFGSGKTSLAAQAPKPLFFDIEGSGRSLLNRREWAILPVIRVSKFDELDDMVRGVITDSKRMGAVKKAKVLLTECETVVIDTINVSRERELDAQRKALSAGRIAVSEYEYTQNNAKLTLLVDFLVEELKKNVIILAQVREDKDNEGNTIVIRPGVPPVLLTSICSIVDAVFYLSSRSTIKGEAVQTKRTLLTVPTESKIAKNRFPLPGRIQLPEENSFEPILHAIRTQREQALKYVQEQQRKVAENADSGS
jgi:hypothetical protein